MERRVVVTGLGAVTPLGNDVKSTWENMIAGKNGIDFVTAFDIGSFKAKLAGEVKGFDPALYMPKGDVRKTDLYAQYALAAAVQAVEDSKIEGTVEPDRMGVYIGSGIGGIHTLVAEHAKGMEKGWNRISPYFVPMMISNIAAARCDPLQCARGRMLRSSRRAPRPRTASARRFAPSVTAMPTR